MQMTIGSHWYSALQTIIIWHTSPVQASPSRRFGGKRVAQLLKPNTPDLIQVTQVILVTGGSHWEISGPGAGADFDEGSSCQL